jgi:hypothetical protein
MRVTKSYKNHLHLQLDEICEALRRTTTLSLIFDREWCDRIRLDIENYKEGSVFSSTSALIFFHLKHPFRGVPWFEKAQSTILSGRLDELENAEKSAIAFIGLDPIKVHLPIWDARLTALSKIPSKREKVEMKLLQLKKARFTPEFRNHFFEVLVLGFFAQKGVLTDLDPAETMVDGIIDIDNRQMLLEVTFTSQELLLDTPGVHTGDVNALLDQVIHKITKKVADGRQLALAQHVPAVLVFGLNRLGADEVIFRIGIEVCFDNLRFSKLSGVVLSDSWKFIETHFYQSKNPEIPLSQKESKTLKEWFDRFPTDSPDLTSP